MAEHVPHYVSLPAISFAATGAITGGRVVEGTGNMTVATGALASIKFRGVAARDAISGAPVPVYVDGVHDLVAGAAIAADDIVCVGPGGTVIPIGANPANSKIGRAFEAIANAATGRILLTP